MEEESLFDKPCWGKWASIGKIIIRRIRIIRIDLNLNLGIKITWNGLAFWKIRRKYLGSRAGKEFLDLMPNTQIHQRTDKLDFMKIRCLYSVKDPGMRIKRQAQTERIFANHISNSYWFYPAWHVLWKKNQNDELLVFLTTSSLHLAKTLFHRNYSHTEHLISANTKKRRKDVLL